MSYSDIRQLPITYRRWFITRLTKHFEQKNAAYKSNNTPSSKPDRVKDIDMGKVKKFFASKTRK